MYGAYGAVSRQCLRAGDTGADVRLLQTKLRERDFGYDDGEQYVFLPVTGTMDANTLSALREFQGSQGLTVDGISGPNTWSRLGETGASCTSRVSSGGSVSVPAGGGSSGGSRGSSGTSLDKPFYQKTWFYWTVGGLTAVALAAILLTPKKRGKK